MDITYVGNPDNLFINLILFYKFEIKAMKSVGYTSFKFKIWDLYNDFDITEN